MAKRARDDSVSHLPELAYAGEGAVTKYKHIDESTVDRLSPRAGAGPMRCFLPPHKPLSFATYEDYDSHYQQTHVHRCSQCHKNFPSPHFTNMHIAENHDPLNEAKKARGEKIYGCFVEDCDKVCSAPEKRRMHLIDKHHFPKNYNFFIVNDGLDRRKSMLRPTIKPRRRSSLLSSPQKDASSGSTMTSQTVDWSREAEIATTDPDAEENVESDESEAGSRVLGQALSPATNGVEDEVDNITRSMSALKFVPASVRFGRGRGRGFPKR